MDRRSQRRGAALILFVILIYLLLSRVNPSSGAKLRSGTQSGSAGYTGKSKSASSRDDVLNLEALQLPPANSTLGFGAVVAISRAGSPRRESLVLAANITEIDITIPEQPQWTDQDIARLRSEHSTISRGSAMAWLGHLNALRWFLSTDLDTVLILEDDVDWDIHLRTRQIPDAAATIRYLTSLSAAEQQRQQQQLKHTLDRKQKQKSMVPYKPKLNNYWGPVHSWDILYLGHCGDIFKPKSWTASVQRALYHDQTLLSRKELHPYTSKFLADIGIPEGQRVIHQSVSPLCTFGFALTRAAALTLLTDVAAKEAEQGTMAYDVRVLEACRDLGFRCWSVNPELFHHLDMPSEISQMNRDPKSAEGEQEQRSGWEHAKAHLQGQGREGGTDNEHRQEYEQQQQQKEGEEPQQEQQQQAQPKTGADAKGRLKPLRMGRAPNIACGARDKNFFTRDARTLEYLREIVGRQGKCLRDQMEEDMMRAPN